MRMLTGLLVLAFLALFVVVGGTWLLFNLFLKLGFNPGNKAWDNLAQKLRGRTQALAPKLVPWDGEMLSLLSLSQIEQRRAGMLNPVESGIFATIYQEPVVAYARQSIKNAGLILAQTSRQEFIFRLKGRETEIWLDGQPFGVLVDGVLLAAGRGSRQLARLESGADESQLPLNIGDRPAAAITNPTAKSDLGPNPRAVTLLRNLTPEEESAALALTLLHMFR